jgi:hypothetical protein
MAYLWGLFQVQDNQIRVEKWESRELSTYAIRKFSGTILNDTTVLLKYLHTEIDTFHFIYLPVKPDSTNQFIK